VKKLKPSSSAILRANTLALANTIAAENCRNQLRKLIAAVRDVQTHRQMNAAEPPAQQDAWERLQLAVLESERILAKPLDKKPR